LEPIPEAAVEKTWQEVAGFNSNRTKKEMIKIGNSQPELLALIVAMFLLNYVDSEGKLNLS